ncbi:hypothetical protein Agabi119p4_883 [Agaricus bisporus var. burnettii]|uniref:Uncharacterized protein n=1 Tax=Agaricus bisporus var. burnettii TaxID=192524 RepID=A0A8H7KL68_AGABI|nr:hypothetical protein Agabi119p4_883 [Agaricus bisporus var. burnettii]
MFKTFELICPKLFAAILTTRTWRPAFAEPELLDLRDVRITVSGPGFGVNNVDQATGANAIQWRYCQPDRFMLGSRITITWTDWISGPRVADDGGGKVFARRALGRRHKSPSEFLSRIVVDYTSRKIDIW